MNWLCPKCGIVVPMEAEEFPIDCRCGLSQELIDADPVWPGFRLGDFVASVLGWVGFRKNKSCRCEERQAALNKFSNLLHTIFGKTKRNAIRAAAWLAPR